MTQAQVFDAALAAKGLTLNASDHAAALAVFTYLAQCKSLLANAPR